MWGGNCRNMPRQLAVLKAQGGDGNDGWCMCVCVRGGGGLLVGCKEFPVELIIPILTCETGGKGGLGRKQGWRWWWWDAVAVNSRLINYTLACGNILPKCHSGPCEATHLTARVQHTHRHT